MKMTIEQLRSDVEAKYSRCETLTATEKAFLNVILGIRNHGGRATHNLPTPSLADLAAQERQLARQLGVKFPEDEVVAVEAKEAV